MKNVGKILLKIITKFLWGILYTVLFLAVLTVSSVTKFFSLMGVNADNVYTLQGNTAEQLLTEDEVTKEIIEISYITNEGTVDTRPVILYKPKDAKGDLPLVFVPHYAIEENSADFQQYIKNGWAAASPAEFINEYNGELANNDLVFNNAALYTLRRREGIDRQRIAIVGGSAGGYMTLMLSEMQMETCASIANSPITNLYFNFNVHFLNCDELNRSASAFDVPIMVQAMVSKLFRPNLDHFSGDDDPLWAERSPIGAAKCFSSPTVVNHYTADILVPMDQITRRYTYNANDGSLPKNFTARMGNDYPGILSHSLEDEANPNELSVTKYTLENHHIDMDMPYTDKLLTVNIYDDGPICAKSGHASPITSGTCDAIPYLRAMFEKSLAQTEKAVPEKLMLLLNRWQGKSRRISAYEGINDTLYGSLAVCRQEVEEELSVYAANHSSEELDTAVKNAIATVSDEVQKEELSKAWAAISGKI